jgi:hypothetical protein
MDARQDDRHRQRALRLALLNADAGWPPPARLPLLALGFAALVVGVGAGLARLGAAVPAIAASSAAMHGPLMVCGFFGVVIALERAVALGRRWAYLGPLLAAIGVVTLLAGRAAAATWLFLAGSIVLLAATLDVLARQRTLFMATLALGAGCFVIGNTSDSSCRASCRLRRRHAMRSRSCWS